jgi:hypothetical protein
VDAAVAGRSARPEESQEAIVKLHRGLVPLILLGSSMGLGCPSGDATTVVLGLEAGAPPAPAAADPGDAQAGVALDEACVPPSDELPEDVSASAGVDATEASDAADAAVDASDAADASDAGNATGTSPTASGLPLCYPLAQSDCAPPLHFHTSSLTCVEECIEPEVLTADNECCELLDSDGVCCPTRLDVDGSCIDEPPGTGPGSAPSCPSNRPNRRCSGYGTCRCVR